MRKVERSAQPDCLRDNAGVWAQEYVAAREKNAKHKFTWRNDGCYQTIRRTLTDMTQHHCAFCDGLIGAESRETIEHFRPKSNFPALAYQWDNLFPCCDVCQSQKLEKFDDGLLKPDTAEYAFNRYFICNYETGELQANPQASETDQARANRTLNLYGLNLPQRQASRQRELKQYSRRDEVDLIDDFSYRYFLEDA